MNYTNEELKEAIRDAESIARTGATREREDFVEWASQAIAYYSSQRGEDMRRACEIVSAQYKAYLKALPERGKKNA